MCRRLCCALILGWLVFGVVGAVGQELTVEDHALITVRLLRLDFASLPSDVFDDPRPGVALLEYAAEQGVLADIASEKLDALFQELGLLDSFGIDRSLPDDHSEWFLSWWASWEDYEDPRVPIQETIQRIEGGVLPGLEGYVPGMELALEYLDAAVPLFPEVAPFIPVFGFENPFDPFTPDAKAYTWWYGAIAGLPFSIGSSQARAMAHAEATEATAEALLAQCKYDLQDSGATVDSPKAGEDSATVTRGSCTLNGEVVDGLWVSVQFDITVRVTCEECPKCKCMVSLEDLNALSTPWNMGQNPPDAQSISVGHFGSIPASPGSTQTTVGPVKNDATNVEGESQTVQYPCDGKQHYLNIRFEWKGFYKDWGRFSPRWIGEQGGQIRPGTLEVSLTFGGITGGQNITVTVPIGYDVNKQGLKDGSAPAEVGEPSIKVD